MGRHLVSTVYVRPLAPLDSTDVNCHTPPTQWQKVTIQRVGAGRRRKQNVLFGAQLTPVTPPLVLILQVQDADLEPMLGPSEADTKLTFFKDTVGREFGYADDDTTGFWDRVEGDYEGP